MVVIRINGTNTSSHDITPKPWLHSMLSSMVKTIITQNLKKAVLYSPLNMSMIICVSEKHTYISAGGHSWWICLAS